MQSTSAPASIRAGTRFFKVSCVDTRADNITLLRVQQFKRVFLCASRVFSEYEIFEIAVFVDYRQGIEFVVPDYVVRGFERCRFVAVNEFLKTAS